MGRESSGAFNHRNGIWGGGERVAVRDSIAMEALQPQKLKKDLKILGTKIVGNGHPVLCG